MFNIYRIIIHNTNKILMVFVILQTQLYTSFINQITFYYLYINEIIKCHFLYQYCNKFLCLSKSIASYFLINTIRNHQKNFSYALMFNRFH